MAATRPVFGPDYIIPKPFDPRLILEIAPAVARAAMESGVARRPIADFAAYRRELERFVFRSGYLMRPVFEAATPRPRARRLSRRARTSASLRAVQTVLDDGIARADPDRPPRGDRGEGPRHGAADGPRRRRARARPGRRIADVFDPLVPQYQRKVGRRGVPPEAAARRVGTRPTVAAAHAAGGRAGGCRHLRRHRQLDAADGTTPSTIIGKPAGGRAGLCPVRLILPTGHAVLRATPT